MKAKAPPRVRIVLVDDNHGMRKATRRLLSFEPDFEIAGEADDGLTAVALVEDLTPHVVIMNYAMPGINGVEATRRIRDLSPETSVIILSSYGDTHLVDAARNAGAAHYFVKPVRDLDKFLAAIRAVAERESTARN